MIKDQHHWKRPFIGPNMCCDITVPIIYNRQAEITGNYLSNYENEFDVCSKAKLENRFSKKKK